MRNEKTKQLQAAYAEANKRLRNRNKSEFEQILVAVYEERGMHVRGRTAGPADQPDDGDQGAPSDGWQGIDPIG